MDMTATKQQLKERWETPKGKRVKELLFKSARAENWPEILKAMKLPFIEEISNRKDLRAIDLEQCKENNITFPSFYKARFSKTDFSYANLKNVYFIEADLHESVFKDSILEGTHFEISHLQGVDFQNLIFNKTIFARSYMMHAKLQNSTFLNSDFREAYLGFANFYGSKFLNGTSFIDANLDNAIIENSTFDEAVLNRTNLHNTNLRNSVIRSTDLSYCLFVKTDLTKTKIVNSKVYGISVWDLKTDKETIGIDLIIREKPLITVGDIEIAQFIYLILNNEKIPNLITTMRTKVVLILGSFDDQSKPILEKIKELLPKHDLIPIVFDFNPPLEQRYIETVKTLALLSKFVIVDLSIRSGQYIEIASIVPETEIPFATIAFEDTKASEMLKIFNAYDWWRKVYFSYPKEGWEIKLPILIEKEIIPWAEEINNKLLKNRMRE